MSFTPNIPASGQTLGNSRPQVLNNFANYNTVMSVNHVAPNDSGQGKHKFVEMPAQGSDPATVTGEIATYCKTSAASAQELYLRRANNGTVIQMSVGDPTAANPGTTFLPGGLIMKFGKGTNNGAHNINYVNAFPNNVFSLVVGIENVGTISYSYGTGGFLDKFTLNTSANVGYDYIAIGN